MSVVNVSYRWRGATAATTTTTAATGLPLSWSATTSNEQCYFARCTYSCSCFRCNHAECDDHNAASCLAAEITTPGGRTRDAADECRTTNPDVQSAPNTTGRTDAATRNAFAGNSSTRSTASTRAANHARSHPGQPGGSRAADAGDWTSAKHCAAWADYNHDSIDD